MVDRCVTRYQIQKNVHAAGVDRIEQPAVPERLEKYKVDLDTLVQLSSPIYRLELMLVGRLFAQDPSLYADIILSSERNIENIAAYKDCIAEQVDMIKCYNRENFIREFLAVREYFGEYAGQFLKESKQLLDQARDSIVHQTL